MFRRRLNISFFGPYLPALNDNDTASYYCGIIHSLTQRGHQVTFYELDSPAYTHRREAPEPEWMRVLALASDDSVYQVLAEARAADLVIKTSDAGTPGGWLDAAVLEMQSADTLVAFWDVDPSSTVDCLARGATDVLHELIPRYDLILTRGGGKPVVETYRTRGARLCAPIYPALDPQTYYPVAADSCFQGALGFVANRLPAYQAQIEEFFLKPAAALAPQRFLLGGRGWEDNIVPANVDCLGPIDEDECRALYSSPLAILCLCSTDKGFFPPAQLFAAAGAGACLITNSWQGLAHFLEPDHEILVAHSSADVIHHLNNLTILRAHQVGEAARRHVLAEHTYARRAAQLEALFSSVRVTA